VCAIDDAVALLQMFGRNESEQEICMSKLMKTQLKINVFAKINKNSLDIYKKIQYKGRVHILTDKKLGISWKNIILDNIDL
jgi:hypothetical protein